MPIRLTTNSCARLRHAADSSILTARPIVRIVYMRDRAGGEGKEAFVVDGQNFAWVALGGPAAALAGDAVHGGLHAGSPVMLVRMSRLAPDDRCSVLANRIEIMYADEGEDDPDAIPLMLTGTLPEMQATLERDHMVQRIGQLELSLELVAASLPAAF